MTPLRLDRLRRWALELIAFGAAAAVVVLLRARGLRLDLHAASFTFGPMLPMLPRILAAGLALEIVATLVARAPLRAYLQEFFTPRSLLLWLRVTVAFMVVTFAYTWLKVCVPLLRDRLWDRELLALDRLLHFGLSPHVFVLELLAGTPLLPALDLWYSLWILTVTGGWAWAAAQPRAERRLHFAIACALLWVAGSWLYLAVPALGPAFVDRAPLLEHGAALPQAGAMQARLAQNYALMLAGRDGSLRQFNPYFGIAALPSLHVGAHWLFALWTRRFARPLFRWSVLATGLTFAGALATGWHYAIDGYVGMALAWLAIRAADRLAPPAVAAAEEPFASIPARGMPPD